ncbi:hypothetical protein JXI42_02195 [bacterium]|nr:hypothetical protein [bacterium]
MRGDKLLIEVAHRKAGKGIFNVILPAIKEATGKYVITIAGESGSGKSEIAAVLSENLSESGFRNLILQQDDYFVYPPKTNARKRLENIDHVGISEVKLDLLDENLRDIIQGKPAIEKPLVIFEEDRIITETLDVKDVKVVIVEGTYTTLLDNVQTRVFIDRDLYDTRESRKRRGREVQDDYLERILSIEHEIISLHKARADIVITKDYDVKEI